MVFIVQCFKKQVPLEALSFRKHPPVPTHGHAVLRFSSTQQGEVDRGRIIFLPAHPFSDFIPSTNQPTNPTQHPL